MTGISFRPTADQRFNERREQRIDRARHQVDVHLRAARRHSRAGVREARQHDLQPALHERRLVHRNLDQARHAVEQLRSAPNPRGYWGIDFLRGAEAYDDAARLADAVHDTRAEAKPVRRLQAAVRHAREVRRNRIAKLDSYLRSKGSPMAGQGATFYRIGKHYGIDPRFLIAIAGQESVFGTRNSARYNAFGYFGTGGGPSSFGSWSQAINRVAWQLAGPLYMGNREYPRDTVYSIADQWAPIGVDNDPGNLNANWPTGVQAYLDQQHAHNYEMTWDAYIEDVSPRRY
jgi:hypothetical protein